MTETTTALSPREIIQARLDEVPNRGIILIGGHQLSQRQNWGSDHVEWTYFGSDAFDEPFQLASRLSETGVDFEVIYTEADGWTWPPAADCADTHPGTATIGKHWSADVDSRHDIDAVCAALNELATGSAILDSAELAWQTTHRSNGRNYWESAGVFDEMSSRELINHIVATGNAPTFTTLYRAPERHPENGATL